MSKAECPITSLNQLNGFLHAVSSTPGATEHQQKASVCTQSVCRGRGTWVYQPALLVLSAPNSPEQHSSRAQPHPFFFFIKKRNICFIPTKKKNPKNQTINPAFISILQYSIPPFLECHFYWAPACCMLAQTIPIRLSGN